ncbi:DUF998 domain-containing protein [Pseudonocardia sp. MH-G8]|uniref:DUF998 domain-containing protein n=1 Tax=Pseudonocardia sp. MH-G8 TaxID=1854588 RepID=UPI001E333D13|nr:DUF998 domain-containing protein [Pseudonocardia sp. MH-G8]
MQRPGRLGVATLLLAVLALMSAARSSVIMVYLGVTFRTEVDPISVPLSYYVFVDGGQELFNSAAVALAIGALALLVGLARAGVRMAGSPTVLLAVWALCLVLAAMFPADDSPQILTVAGWVHQFAGAGILALLSLAGLAAAPRLAESLAWRPVVPTVRVLSAGAAALAVAYVVSRLDDIVPGIFGAVDVGGILQRMVLAFDVAVVAALAVQLVRVSWVAVRSGAAAAPPAVLPRH